MSEINLNGYGENVVTVIATEGLEKGSIVKVTANYKVGACADGNSFFGVVVNVRGGFAAVQTKGYFKVKKSGTINLGYQELAAASASSVKALSGGVPCNVIAFDSTYVEFII